jgi:hypothetical protein
MERETMTSENSIQSVVPATPAEAAVAAAAWERRGILGRLVRLGGGSEVDRPASSASPASAAELRAA